MNNYDEYECMQKLESQYRIIVDSTNIVSKTDTKGIITFANAKFIELSGYSKEELLGKPHNIIRDPKSDAALFQDLWKTIQSKKVWNGVISNLAKNGTKYIVEASIFPILGKNNKIVEYIAIRHDITELMELNKKVNALHDYDIQQQTIAKEKLEAGIINDLSTNDCCIIYLPSDILSGDFYSIYKRKDGSTFIYLTDGQGHGISPALTVFAISSTINHLINTTKNLEELTRKLFPRIKNFLAEEEQLSFSMIMINPDATRLCYTTGGMYPFLIKKNDEEIIKVKANNTPFMNFSDTPSVGELNIQGFESLLLYSDGLIEHEDKRLQKFTPENIIQNPSLIVEAKEIMKSVKLEDDVTLLYVH